MPHFLHIVHGFSAITSFLITINTLLVIYRHSLNLGTSLCANMLLSDHFISHNHKYSFSKFIDILLILGQVCVPTDQQTTHTSQLNLLVPVIKSILIKPVNGGRGLGTMLHLMTGYSLSTSIPCRIELYSQGFTHKSLNPRKVKSYFHNFHSTPKNVTDRIIKNTLHMTGSPIVIRS